jgi:hypothetical protein
MDADATGRAAAHPPKPSRMTTDASQPPSSQTPITGLRCPHCHVGEVRRSHRRHDDSLMHRLFYRGYRCRTCRTRFWRLDRSTVAVVAAVVLLVGAAIWGGIAFDEHLGREADPPIVGTPPATAPVGATPIGTEPLAAEPGWSAANSPAINTGLFSQAEKGDARAQYHLAVAYLNGHGVARNTALALKWLDQAARQDHADAQYALGTIHLAGRGVRQNFQTAFKWFDMAAQQNHAESQYQVGLMYRSGSGVGVDKSRAYVWFNLAAAQGHARAAIERDRLLPTMTADQVAVAQRNAEAWRPTTAKP